MRKKFLKINFSLFLTALLTSCVLFSAPAEVTAKEGKTDSAKVEEKKAVAKPKAVKTVTRQLIYCTAKRKIIPVGQFLLRDGVVSAIVHPAPISRLFITAKASPGYYLVSPNKKSCVKAQIDKTAIESVGTDGAKIALLVSDAEAMMFIIEGNGFKPGEQVKLISSSHDENIEEELTATSEGQLFAVLAPAVVGKAGGFCKTQVVRQSETLQFKFPWGEKAQPRDEQKEVSSR